MIAPPPPIDYRSPRRSSDSSSASVETIIIWSIGITGIFTGLSLSIFALLHQRELTITMIVVVPVVFTIALTFVGFGLGGVMAFVYTLLRSLIFDSEEPTPPKPH